MSSTTPVVSVRPVVVPAPGRGDDLQVRVSVPAGGGHLPVVVFSHGFSQSLDAYAPLADHWAAHGFAVLQPTHLDSATLRLPPEDPRHPGIWRHRIADLGHVLDALDLLEAAVPGTGTTFDRDRVAAAGHSWGGQTAGALLGARVLDRDGVPGEDFRDARVRAGVLLATAGTGGADLSPFAAERFPFMNPGFEDLRTPTLVVAGDADRSPLTTRGPDWFTDVFHLSPGATALLTLFGAGHSLGGIVGLGHRENTDEDPARVALVQRTTTAFLRTALDVDPASWPTALAGSDPLGRIDVE